jgi:hypothetical protein
VSAGVTAGYKGDVSYQPEDPAGAVLLTVQASQALAAAGQADMVWGHVSIRDPGGRGTTASSRQAGSTCSGGRPSLTDPILGAVTNPWRGSVYRRAGHGGGSDVPG